jgi:hypothetical protein
MNRPPKNRSNNPEASIESWTYSGVEDEHEGDVHILWKLVSWVQIRQNAYDKATTFDNKIRTHVWLETNCFSSQCMRTMGERKGGANLGVVHVERRGDPQMQWFSPSLKRKKKGKLIDDCTGAGYLSRQVGTRIEPQVSENTFMCRRVARIDPGAQERSINLRATSSLVASKSSWHRKAFKSLLAVLFDAKCM